MRKEYDEIVRISDQYPQPIGNRVSKTVEEFGEMAKEINRLIGMKTRDGISDSVIRENIIAEGADTIQNILCLLCSDGIKAEYDEIIEALNTANNRWESKYLKKNA